MHRVLFIQEILLDIFGHCSPAAPLDESCHKADLAVLARTCQTCKEPALDVLWEKLFNLSPLPRCLPEACRFDGVCASFHCVDITRFNMRLFSGITHSAGRRVKPNGIVSEVTPAVSGPYRAIPHMLATTGLHFSWHLSLICSSQTCDCCTG